MCFKKKKNNKKNNKDNKKDNKLYSKTQNELLNKIISLSFTENIDELKENINKLKQSSFSFKPKIVKTLYKNTISNGLFETFKCVNNMIDLNNNYFKSFGCKIIDKLFKQCLKSENVEFYKYLIEIYPYQINYFSLFLVSCSVGNVKLFLFNKDLIPETKIKENISDIFIKICSGGNIDLMNYLVKFLSENPKLKEKISFNRGVDIILLSGNYELLKWMNDNKYLDDYFSNKFKIFLNKYPNFKIILSQKKNNELSYYLENELKVLPSNFIKIKKEKNDIENTFLSYIT